MKVLVSAIACHPYYGSEPYFGWSAVKALAKEHELWVLTTPRHEPDFQRAAQAGLIPDNVHLVHVGSFSAWHPNRLYARVQAWREYLQFSKDILPAARQLHTSVKFDLVHHVTYATWRVASPLWQLGVPFVFGPVGGCEQFPLRLFPILSGSAKAFELARMMSNTLSRFSPGVRRCLRGAARVLVANAETGKLASAVRGSAKEVILLSAGFFAAERIREFARFAGEKSLAGPLRLFAAGNIEGRKGLALALEALAAAKQSGLQFQYRLGASGPEAAWLKQLAVRLGLEKEVLFGESLRGEAYPRELGQTHLFLLPSLRESAGLTMMEAMLAGCVPVVVEGGGPGLIVTEESGYKIPVSNRRQMVRQLTEIILKLNHDRQLMLEVGKKASARIADNFSEDHYRRVINSVYQDVVKRR